MTKRAAIYARISKADKTTPKVANQIELCRALADDNDYGVVAIFEDDGIAASGKAIDDVTLQNRPGANKLLDAIRAGEFDVLLAVEGERLARTYLDGLEWVKASVTGKVIWHLDSDGVLDPSTPAGEEIAMGIFTSGRREGRVRDARQKRRYNSERASGMPLWGTRPYGYEKDRINIRETEAVHIRTAVSDYLAGKRSMLGIAHDWTERGLVTDGMLRPRKGRDGETRLPQKIWTATTVRQLLLRERNAGLLVHDGARLPGSQIEAIISEQQLDDMKARVKTGTKMGARAVSLLGGIIRCECGAAMHSTISYSQRKGGPRHVYRVYKCSRTLYDKGNRHASIRQSLADDLFTGFVTLALFNGELASPESSGVEVALQEVTARLAAGSDNIAHVSGILLDRDLKTLHAIARGQLMTFDAQRVELLAERDALLTRAREDGGLAAFMDAWRGEDLEAFESLADFEHWEVRFRAMWDSVAIEKRRGLIEARYRPVVKVGGKGVGRIAANPVGQATAATQPSS